MTYTNDPNRKRKPNDVERMAGILTMNKNCKNGGTRNPLMYVLIGAVLIHEYCGLTVGYSFGGFIFFAIKHV